MSMNFSPATGFHTIWVTALRFRDTRTAFSGDKMGNRILQAHIGTALRISRQLLVGSHMPRMRICHWIILLLFIKVRIRHCLYAPRTKKNKIKAFYDKNDLDQACNIERSILSPFRIPNFFLFHLVRAKRREILFLG